MKNRETPYLIVLGLPTFIVFSAFFILPLESSWQLVAVVQTVQLSI